ncbi:MAG: GTP 3',8-cyclase MoaA, partial [Xanthomonadales bacterium]|nr:GTP 3',8-cyclase MoaA [Xanthomonadales bacterium]
ISSITQPFCGDCTRARVTADGNLYSCLFAHRGAALRPLLRQRSTDDALEAFLRGQWQAREDRYSELRTSDDGESPRVEMFRMGG